MTNKQNDNLFVEIKQNFNKAFEQLPPEQKEFCDTKELCLGIPIDMTNFWEVKIVEDGRIRFLLNKDEVIKREYLKNRFVLKETPFSIYLLPVQKAMLAGLSIVGTIQEIPSTQERQELYLYVKDPNGEPTLSSLEVDKFDSVTKLTDKIYIAQKYGALIALEVGFNPNTVEEIETEEDNQFLNGYV